MNPTDYQGADHQGADQGADQLRARVAELERDLAENGTSTGAVEDGYRFALDKLRADRAAAEELAKVRAADAQQCRDKLRRCAAEHVQLCRALRELYRAFTSKAVLEGQGKWSGDVHRAIQDAADILQLCDIPF